MPSTKEIRAKIRSVHNTRKITKAMEMVAASKMKKAQDRMRAARPYGNTIRNLIGHLADASTEAVHPFLRKAKEVNNIGLICVSTDKGLAGALNTNIQRLLAHTFRDWAQEGKKVEATAIGNTVLTLSACSEPLRFRSRRSKKAESTSSTLPTLALSMR